MGFLVHSGAEHDPEGLEGLSHFVEHLVSRNANIPKREICAFFESHGGSVNLGGTGHSCTQYLFFAPADRTILATAFSIFGHMLLSAKLEKYIERERQVITNEFYRKYPAEFRFDLDMRKHKALYTGCWLEKSTKPFGTLGSIGRITQEDVQAHYDRHYVPANISVVGVGGATLENLVKLLSESPFATSKEGLRMPLPNPVTDVSPPSDTRCMFKMSDHISMSVPMKVCSYHSTAKIPGNANSRAIRIMERMFDELLDEEVRDRRAWTYDISISRSNFQSFHEFSIDCGTLALEALDGIEEVIEECISSMSERKNLFEQSKRSVLASNLMIDSNGRGICDGALDDLAENHRIISLSEYGDDIERVTMDDIRKLLKWLSPEWRWTLIMSP